TRPTAALVNTATHASRVRSAGPGTQSGSSVRFRVCIYSTPQIRVDFLYTIGTSIQTTQYTSRSREKSPCSPTGSSRGSLDWDAKNGRKSNGSTEISTALNASNRCAFQKRILWPQKAHRKRTAWPQ